MKVEKYDDEPTRTPIDPTILPVVGVAVGLAVTSALWGPVVFGAAGGGLLGLLVGRAKGR